MTEIMHADVFFFVTTAVVVVLGAVLVTVLLYTVSILADVKYITKKLKQGSDDVLEDLQHLRERFKNEGFKLLNLGAFLGGFFAKKRKGGKSKE